METSPTLLLNGRFSLSSYGSGAFQFSGRTHRGGILILPDGIYAWASKTGSFYDAAFLQLLDDKSGLHGDFLLLGTGSGVSFPPASFRSAIDERGLGLEIMDTGAACRTYNVLLAENRLFVAGLLPI